MFTPVIETALVKRIILVTRVTPVGLVRMVTLVTHVKLIILDTLITKLY